MLPHGSAAGMEAPSQVDAGSVQLRVPALGQALAVLLVAPILPRAGAGWAINHHKQVNVRAAAQRELLPLIPPHGVGAYIQMCLYSCSGDGSKKSHSQVTAFPISTFPALNIPRLCRRNLGMSRAEDAVDTALKGSAAHPTPHSCILSSSSSFPHCSVFSSGMEPSRKKPHSSLSPFQWCSEADAGCSECR